MHSHCYEGKSGSDVPRAAPSHALIVYHRSPRSAGCVKETPDESNAKREFESLEVNEKFGWLICSIESTWLVVNMLDDGGPDEDATLALSEDLLAVSTFVSWC